MSRHYEIIGKEPGDAYPRLAMSLRTEWNHTAAAWEAMSDLGERQHLGRPDDSQHDVALHGFAKMIGTTTREKAHGTDIATLLAELHEGWRVRLASDSSDGDTWTIELWNRRYEHRVHRYCGKLEEIICRAHAGSPPRVDRGES